MEERESIDRSHSDSWQATKWDDFDWRQRGHWRNSPKVGLFINFLSFLRGKTEVKFKRMPPGHGHIPKETFCIENLLLGVVVSEEIDDGTATKSPSVNYIVGFDLK